MPQVRLNPDSESGFSHAILLFPALLLLNVLGALQTVMCVCEGLTAPHFASLMCIRAGGQNYGVLLLLEGSLIIMGDRWEGLG